MYKYLRRETSILGSQTEVPMRLIPGFEGVSKSHEPEKTPRIPVEIDGDKVTPIREIPDNNFYKTREEFEGDVFSGVL